ncbi:cytochrome b [Rhodanobacter sp. AS-Z3]|uniref:cytochrome b n=1 Tax=Rhodanobacter sp. AS-Z3 TaxID=3031330 RepID=UPI00247959AE|nr:cytochrome b [Rhodanobacter sp. AS-Z3]WEN15662.1 cytochrome b [Rhodanobacter sp. AS-Z3]
MNANHNSERYHTLSMAAHWLTLALLIAVYALIELRGIYPKGTAAHDAMKTWHFMLGLSVFAVVLVRMVLRLIYPAPSIQPPLPVWQHRLAALMHLALYAFLLVMPLLGWLTLSAKGRVIPFFGLELPALIGPNKAWAGSLEDIHTTIGTIGYYLIGLHAAAALYHHYFMHDNTLMRMLPGRKRAAGTSRRS